MSKAVLISIHPEWCDKIASGQKTIEVRKTRPKIETPFKCYIYCTKPKRYSSDVSLYTDELYRLPSGEIKFGSSIELSRFPDQWNKDNFLNGKVIGEFICRDIEPITPYGCLSTRYATPRTCKTNLIIKSGLYPESKLIDYLGYNKGFAWHISDLVIYDKPKYICTFRKWCKEECELCVLDYTRCSNSIPLERPPQSWCYVQERFLYERSDN